MERVRAEVAASASAVEKTWTAIPTGIGAGGNREAKERKETELVNYLFLTSKPRRSEPVFAHVWEKPNRQAFLTTQEHLS